MANWCFGDRRGAGRPAAPRGHEASAGDRNARNHAVDHPPGRSQPVTQKRRHGQLTHPATVPQCRRLGGGRLAAACVERRLKGGASAGGSQPLTRLLIRETGTALLDAGQSLGRLAGGPFGRSVALVAICSCPPGFSGEDLAAGTYELREPIGYSRASPPHEGAVCREGARRGALVDGPVDVARSAFDRQPCFAVEELSSFNDRRDVAGPTSGGGPGKESLSARGHRRLQSTRQDVRPAGEGGMGCRCTSRCVGEVRPLTRV